MIYISGPFVFPFFKYIFAYHVIPFWIVNLLNLPLTLLLIWFIKCNLLYMYIHTMMCCRLNHLITYIRISACQFFFRYQLIFLGSFRATITDICFWINHLLAFIEYYHTFVVAPITPQRICEKIHDRFKISTS